MAASSTESAQLAITCPHCQSRPVDSVRQFSVLRGLLLTAQSGAVTVIGCRPCVRAKGRAAMMRNLALGWWSLPWGLLTPFVVLQNLFAICKPGAGPLDDALRSCGIEPDDWRPDSHGLTLREWDLLWTSASALRRFADRSALPDVVTTSVEWLCDFADNRITATEAHTMLREALGHRVLPQVTPIDFRDGLLWAIAALIPEDRPHDYLDALRATAEWLQCTPDTVREILTWLADRMMAVPAAESALLQAYSLLGVVPSTPLKEVHRAYKRLLLQSHPDRAVLTGMSVEDATSVTQRIVEAYQLVVQSVRVP